MITTVISRKGIEHPPIEGDKILYGRSRELSLANGERRTVKYAIVDLSFLKASHHEETFSSTVGYPTNEFGQNVNDRNYKDDTSAQRQVVEVAQNLEPERLIELSSKASGTPVITEQGFVISGNNRTMSLKLAVKRFPDSYKRYLDYLAAEVDVFGFDKHIGISLLAGERIALPGSSFHDPKSIRFLHPVLVRVDPSVKVLTTTELAKFNQDTKKGERTVDKVIKLSNILRENEKCRQVVLNIVDGYDTFSEFFGPGAGNDRKKLVNTFIDCGLITENQLPQYYDEGQFSEGGKDFVENLLAGMILEPDAIKVAGKEGVKRVRQIIITCLPVLIANENLGEGSLKKLISDAVVVQYKIQQVGGDFFDFIRAQSLFDEEKPSEKAVMMNLLLNQGRNAFKDAIVKYNNAMKSNEGPQMFSEEVLTQPIIFQRTIVAALPAKELGATVMAYMNEPKTEPMPEKIRKPVEVVTIERLDFTTPTVDETVADWFIDDNFFKAHPDKVLGTPYQTSSKFGGEVTKYKGDISAVDRIDAPTDFIGNNKVINDVTASVGHFENASAKVLQPDVEEFVEKVLVQSDKDIAKITVKKKKKPVVNDDATVTEDLPELQTFEEIYDRYNPEITRQELAVFLWYKTQVGRPLSKRWARLLDRNISASDLNAPHDWHVPQEVVDGWISQGLLYFYEDKYLPAFLYLAEDIYERKSQLLRDKDDIVSKHGADVYQAQERALMEVFSRKYENRLLITADSDSGMIVLSNSKFAKNFKVSRLDNMGEDDQFAYKTVTAKSNKRFGQPDWEKDALADKKDKTVFSELSLKDAFAFWLRKSRPELKENVSHHEIVAHYLEGRPMRSKYGADADPAVKRAEEAQFVALRSLLQKEAERLFRIFLNDELTPEDKFRLEVEWNSKYNNYVPIDYNKVPVAFTMCKYYKGQLEEIRAEKREAVAFMLSTGSGCLAFDVGVGKTPSAIFTISAFMDAGYSRRPFICVPNQVYKQFISEVRNFAPHIPILEAYNLGDTYVENFKGPDGKIQKVPAGTLTVMTYEGLEQIGFGDFTFQELKSDLYEILNQGGASEMKQSKGQKEAFAERLEGLLGRSLRGTLHNIEDFGFDFGCYDEAHKMKKVFTSVKGEVVKDLGAANVDEKTITKATTREKSPYEITSGVPSSIALKGFMLNQYIQRQNNFGNVLLLTATPFTNSPLEIFSMLTMLAYDKLRNTDLNNIKNFFDTYVRTSTDLVINAKLKPQYKQVILGFNNLVSMQTLIRRFINYKTGEDVNVQRPNKIVIPYLKKVENGVTITLDESERVECNLPMTPQQKGMMDDIVAYVEGKMSLEDLGSVNYGEQEELDEDAVAPESDGEEVSEASLGEKEKAGVKVLRGMSLARNLALSPYLYEYSGMGAPDYRSYIETSPKLKYTMECIRSAKRYHEGKGEAMSGQVIYMDRGIEYFPLIRQYLIEVLKFKPHEVAIIKSGMPTGNKKGSKDFIKNLFNGEIYNEGTKQFDPVSDEERIKVIIGSSTIKEGINLQRYSTCLYNLFIDWNPTDFLQLQGRIWRQGNLFNSVRITVPLVVDSMDIFIFQKLQEKTSRLNTIWSSDGKTNVLKVEEFDASELKYALIRDPKSVAELILIDETVRIDKEILSIKRLEDRIDRIKNYVSTVNSKFEAAEEWLKDFRHFVAGSDKLKDAAKLSALIADVIKKQTDKEGKKFKPAMGNSSIPYAMREQYNMEIGQQYKPYWLDEFNSAQRNIARELKNVDPKDGFHFTLTDITGLDAYKEKKQALIKGLEEQKAELKSEGNIAKITEQVIADRAEKKTVFKSVAQAIADWSKLNHLLSDRKVAKVIKKKQYNSCPPTLPDGQRDISDEALAYMNQCLENEPDTKFLNTNPDTGAYKPERLVVHNEIINHEFQNVRCVKKGKPIAVFTGGSPGSGKSTFMKKHAKYLLSPEIFSLDADAIRAQLPEYKGWNANSTHRETQDIVNSLLDRLGEGDCRYDFIYDGTMNKAQKYFKLIKKVKDLGYETYIIFMNVPFGTAKKRILERYQRTGRFVPMIVLEEFFQRLPDGKTRGEDALDQLRSIVDGYVVVDGISGEITERGGKEMPSDRHYGDFFKAKGPAVPGEKVKEKTNPLLTSVMTKKDEIKNEIDEKHEIPLTAKQKAEKQIKTLKISLKFLKGVDKAGAEKEIKTLTIALKYL